VDTDFWAQVANPAEKANLSPTMPCPELLCLISQAQSVLINGIKNARPWRILTAVITGFVDFLLQQPTDIRV